MCSLVIQWSVLNYSNDQGAEALDKVRKAVQAGEHCALAFVDIRMAPGWNGSQTIEHLCSVDPALQVVICSAYSDYAWDEILARLNRSDHLLVVKKPFEAVEVLQCANALTGKWRSERELRRHLATCQVFLNLIVNAAHALADAGRDPESGKITIRTGVIEGWLELQFKENA